jgi:hypothetical protein
MATIRGANTLIKKTITATTMTNPTIAMIMELKSKANEILSTLW